MQHYQRTLRYLPHIILLIQTFAAGILLYLLAVCSLTGCDANSKVDVKTTVLKYTEKLFDFGKETMVTRAELFLVKYLGEFHISSMNYPTDSQYHQKKIQNFQDMLPTSRSLRLHKKEVTSSVIFGRCHS